MEQGNFNRRLADHAQDNMIKIDFSPPYIDQDIIDEVVSSIKSMWITTGPRVKSLEEEIRKLTGTPQALCVNSWSSGAILLLKWFGIKEGDEVIIPAYTYCATALSIMHCGAKPVMVDIKDDFTIDTDKLRLKITGRTKVIMPVDFGGWLCNYDEINALVNEPEIKNKFSAGHPRQEKLGRILVIADAAHSLGATYMGKQQGCLTDVAIFSFHAVKNITTAEGGAICINLPDPFDVKEEYEYLRQMTLNSQTKNAYDKSMATGMWKYDVVDLGMKINMPDICAAIGLVQIRKYGSFLLQERRKKFQYYSTNFRQYSWAQLPPQDNENSTSSYHLYALRIKGITEKERDEMISFLFSKEIRVNVHFIPLPMLTLFKNSGYKMEEYPKAYENYSREISLPIYPQLAEAELDYVISSVVEAYQHAIHL